MYQLDKSIDSNDAIFQTTPVAFIHSEELNYLSDGKQKYEKEWESAG